MDIKKRIQAERAKAERQYNQEQTEYYFGKLVGLTIASSILAGVECEVADLIDSLDGEITA